MCISLRSYVQGSTQNSYTKKVLENVNYGWTPGANVNTYLEKIAEIAALHEQFKPDLTPDQMLRLGVLKG